jgi:RecA-family ATPase
MKKNFPETDDFMFTVLPSGQRNIAMVQEHIEAIQPDVVILDPLTNLLKKEDKKEDVEALLNILDGLIEKYGISIVLIHHARK